MYREKYGEEKYINLTKLMAYKKQIQADDVLVLTDIQVKYATLLEKNKSIATSAKQAVAAGSDGIIVTGNFSGDEPQLDDVIEAKQAVGDFPVLIGSGPSAANANILFQIADGAIVGTSIKGKNGNISQQKIRQLVSSKTIP